MTATRDQALKALRATPAGDYESRMRAGLAAQKSGLDLVDWVTWLEGHGHVIDRDALSRLWWLFSLVSTRAMRGLFLCFQEAA